MRREGRESEPRGASDLSQYETPDAYVAAFWRREEALGPFFRSA